MALGLAAKMDRDIREGRPAGQVIAGAVGEIGVYVALAGVATAQPEIVAAGAAMQAGARAWKAGKLTDQEMVSLAGAAAYYATGAEIDPAEDFLEQIGAETIAEALQASDLARAASTGGGMFGPAVGAAIQKTTGLSGLFN